MGFFNSIGSWFEKITDGWVFGLPTSKLTVKRNVTIEGSTGARYNHEFQDKDGIVAHLDDIPNFIYQAGNHSEFLNLLNSSQLVPGKAYLLEDFQTIYRIPSTTEIFTGPIERLILTAIAEDKFDSKVTSLDYPDDEITLDFANIVCEDGSTPRKGLILRRHDTVKNLDIDCDFRNVIYRRRKLTSRNFQATGTLFSGDTVAITINSNQPGFTTYIKYEVTFGALTHAAGSMNIRITYNNGTVTKPILKFDTGTWGANGLSNQYGQLVYCRVRDSFVFMTYTLTGANLINKYACPDATNTYTIGNNVSFNVDVNDYVDYPIINASTAENVTIRRAVLSANLIDDMNNVFFCNVKDTLLMQGAFKNNFGIHQPSGTMRYCTFLKYVASTVIEEAMYDATFLNRVELLYKQLHPGSFSTINFYMEGNVWASTIRVPYATRFNNNRIEDVSFMLNSGSSVNVHGDIYQSGIYITGNSSTASTYQGVTILSGIYRSLVGYFTWNQGVLDYFIANSSIVDTQSMSSRTKSLAVDTLKISTTSIPSGDLGILFTDSQGNVIKGGASQIPGYNASVPQRLAHDASGLLLWINE